MDEPLEVVIVGGVVAGWMTAAALVGLLSPTIRRVRLIEAAGTGAAVGGRRPCPACAGSMRRSGWRSPR